MFPGQTFYSTPVFIIPKLYANTVYMVLNSRIRILGGRDTYMSSTDIIIATGSIMIQDTSSFSPQGSSGTDGRQGRASVVAISKEVLDGDYEMRQMNVSHYSSCTLLELIFPPGQDHRTRARICRVTVRVHFLSLHYV